MIPFFKGLIFQVNKFQNVISIDVAKIYICFSTQTRASENETILFCEKYSNICSDRLCFFFITAIK